jgi:hypothetical protein
MNITEIYLKRLLHKLEKQTRDLEHLIKRQAAIISLHREEIEKQKNILDSQHNDLLDLNRRLTEQENRQPPEATTPDERP